jgi:hypothetical protein
VVYIQALYRLTRVRQTGLTISRGVDSSPQGSPALWPQLGEEEVRGPTSWVVPDNGTGTTSVEDVKALPVPGVQKPPRQVGKRFWDCHMAVPRKEKAKKPLSLNTRPLGWGKTAWA